MGVQKCTGVHLLSNWWGQCAPAGVKRQPSPILLPALFTSPSPANSISICPNPYVLFCLNLARCQRVSALLCKCVRRSGRGLRDLALACAFACFNFGVLTGAAGLAGFVDDEEPKEPILNNAGQPMEWVPTAKALDVLRDLEQMKVSIGLALLNNVHAIVWCRERISPVQVRVHMSAPAFA